MPHPRRLQDYHQLHIRIDPFTSQYLESIRKPDEGHSALIRRMISEHQEMAIMEKWNKPQGKEGGRENGILD